MVPDFANALRRVKSIFVYVGLDVVSSCEATLYRGFDPQERIEKMNTDKFPLLSLGQDHHSHRSHLTALRLPSSHKMIIHRSSAFFVRTSSQFVLQWRYN